MTIISGNRSDHRAVVLEIGSRHSETDTSEYPDIDLRWTPTGGTRKDGTFGGRERFEPQYRRGSSRSGQYSTNCARMSPGSRNPLGAQMSEISSKLEALGLVLPAPIKPPPGIILPFSWIRVRGNRGYVSGHIALQPDGSIAEPLGKVGAEVSQEQGYEAARRTALAILGSLERELGDLDRITAWLRVFGMVNAAPGFDRFPLVINGFSDLIIQVFGAERGGHARSAVGMAGLPFGTPVEIEAEVEVRT